VAARTLLRGRDVNLFEIVQTAGALAVGFGGAMYVARTTGHGAAPIAAMNLVVGAGCSGVAFAFLARLRDFRRNFYFYTSLGLMLVLVSTALLLSGPAVALTWTVVAISVTGLALRTGRTTLNSHAAVYVVAAAAVSGLLTAASAALAAPAGAAWPSMGPIAVAVLVGVAACWAIPMSPAGASSPVGRTPRLAIAIVLVWSAAGWLVAALVAALPHADLGSTPASSPRVTACRHSRARVAWAGRSARPRDGWLLTSPGRG
jgi:hypothetical protein